VQVLAMGVLLKKLKKWGLVAGEGLAWTVAYTVVYAVVGCLELVGYMVFYLTIGVLAGGFSP